MTTMRQKMSEVGWFYHAPAKRQTAEPIEVPATSQIPGLSDFTALPEEKPREMVFKDTDSKYIRMAKLGGRKDLLVMQERDYRSKEPKSYPRNEWYYLEDNAIEDAQQRQETNWESLLPEYMVHQEYKPEGNNTEGGKSRAPYAFDKHSAFEREGDTITDKTIKLPEVRQPGYGIRSKKPLKMKKQPEPRVPTTHSSQVQGDRPRLKCLPMPSASDAENPMLSKILSNAYKAEWEESAKEWHQRQERQNKKAGSLAQGKGTAPTSEYKDTISKNNSALPGTGGKNKTRRGPGSIHSASSHTSNSKNRQITDEEKELFKLSKFKNVAARVDTHHQPKHTVAAIY